MAENVLVWYLRAMYEALLGVVIVGLLCTPVKQEIRTTWLEHSHCYKKICLFILDDIVISSRLVFIVIQLHIYP